MKSMLILTGPQGAGNHLWSKVFSLHPEVWGWKSLLENYWEAHRTAEPFCEHWKDHSLLNSFDWSVSDYYFTSISCPIGIKEKKWMPDIAGFERTLNQLGIETQIVVVGRDQTILEYQQTRIRKESTFPEMLEQLPKFKTSAFLSYELLYLYRADYIRSLNVNIPTAPDDPRLHGILENDSNKKYISYVDEYVLDQCNITGVTMKELPK